MRRYSNPDEHTRRLGRQLAAGDMSAHAPLLAAMLRAGDLPRVQLEVLAALGDPYASQVVEAPLRILFRSVRGPQEDWFNDLQIGTREEALALDDLVLATGRVVMGWRRPEFTPVQNSAINTMYAIGRNATRQGPTGVGRRMVDMIERGLVNAFGEDGTPWDARCIGTVESAVFLFISMETTPFTRSSDATDVALRIMDHAWSRLRVRARMPTREITPWLRRTVISELRRYWRLPGVGPGELL